MKEKRIKDNDKKTEITETAKMKKVKETHEWNPLRGPLRPAVYPWKEKTLIP